MDKIEEGLFNAYAVELCRDQLGIYQIRQTRMDTDIQRYFNSTPVRNAFSRLMCLATYTKSLYTKTNIATELHTSRQAAHVMADECLDAGWIERPNGEGYRATESLVWAMDDYTHKHLELFEDDKCFHALSALLNYRKLRQAT